MSFLFLDVNLFAQSLHNYMQTKESFTDFWRALKRRFKVAKDHVTRSCDEHKNFAGGQKMYWEVELRSHIYIEVRDQRVRELIDELAEDQHTLDRYIETGESYEASK